MRESTGMIPYARQWVDDDDRRAVQAVLQGDWLTTGPAVERFEAALCEATGAGYAVAVNSGTAALHAAYAAVGVGPGGEVVTTPLTFLATANAAVYLGARVRFADICGATGLIDPGAVDRLVGPSTQAIVAVDYAGHPADYGALREIAVAHKVALVADAAHSLGAARGNEWVGTMADVSCLSFHPVKPITTGEGGAVLTDDPEIAARARRFRNHGVTRDPARWVGGDEGPWNYEMHELGHNYRLTDLQAALGTSQLKKLGLFVARRAEIAARYRAELAGVDELCLPVVEPGVRPGWHLFVVRIRGDGGRRRALFERLHELGLGVQVHYRPVCDQPYYRRQQGETASCPVARHFYERAISLPLFPAMEDREVEAVIEGVRQAVGEVLR